LPFFRRLPFIRGEGFTPIHRVEYNEVNLDQLNGFDAQSEITPEALAAARLLRDSRDPVVILGRGEVNVPLKVRVQRVSKGARAKIEAAGGSVETVE
jgi:large subunit ribosomal protein L15